MDTQSDISIRIEQAMQAYTDRTGEKISWHNLTSKIGKTPSASTNWKKGRISKDTIKDIATLLEVSAEWLIYGNGVMHNDKSSSENDVLYLEIGHTYAMFVLNSRKCAELLKSLNELCANNSVFSLMENNEKITEIQNELSNLQKQQTFLKNKLKSFEDGIWV